MAAKSVTGSVAGGRASSSEITSAGSPNPTKSKSHGLVLGALNESADPQGSAKIIPKLKVKDTKNTYNIIGCDPQSNGMANRVADLAKSLFEITVKPYNEHIRNKNNQLNDLSDFRMHFWEDHVLVVYKESDEHEKTWTVNVDEAGNFNVTLEEKKNPADPLVPDPFPKNLVPTQNLSIGTINTVLKGEQVGRVNDETLKAYKVNLGLKPDSSGATRAPSPTLDRTANGDSEEDGSHQVQDKSKGDARAAPAARPDPDDSGVAADLVGPVRHKPRPAVAEAVVAQGSAQALLDTRVNADERQTAQQKSEVSKGGGRGAAIIQYAGDAVRALFVRRSDNVPAIDTTAAARMIDTRAAAEAASPNRASAQPIGSADGTAGDLSVANTEAPSDGAPETRQASQESMEAFDKRNADATLAEVERESPLPQPPRATAPLPSLRQPARADIAAAAATATTDFGSLATAGTEREAPPAEARKVASVTAERRAFARALASRIASDRGFRTVTSARHTRNGVISSRHEEAVGQS